jgi:hypothetical protein
VSEHCQTCRVLAVASRLLATTLVGAEAPTAGGVDPVIINSGPVALYALLFRPPGSGRQYISTP